ncbi:AlpA family phage regulatory protein [Paraburkholderia sp. RL17-337-BIB-A]
MTTKPSLRASARASFADTTNAQPASLQKNGLVRFNQIAPFLPFGRETWRQRVRDGRAPQPIRLTDRCTVWRAEDVHAWFADPLNYRAGEAV